MFTKKSIFKSQAMSTKTSYAVSAFNVEAVDSKLDFDVKNCIEARKQLQIETGSH